MKTACLEHLKSYIKDVEVALQTGETGAFRHRFMQGVKGERPPFDRAVAGFYALVAELRSLAESSALAMDSEEEAAELARIAGEQVAEQSRTEDDVIAARTAEAERLRNVLAENELFHPHGQEA